jgi:crotonobetainyl-CoA:carnitine CoA-transferase CaiB-like acyl-CoA transferase
MSKKPLQGLRVADFGVGMAAALIAKFLAEQGAEVMRVEPKSGDPFFKIYPAYGTWRSFTQKVDRYLIDEASGLRDLLAKSDVCIVGGEDHPDLSLPAQPAALPGHERLITLRIAGSPPGTPPMPAVDILAQARTGLVHEHFSARPNLLAFRPAEFGVVFGGLMGVFAALYDRERTGHGQVVQASYLLGALSWSLSFLWSADRPSSEFDGVVPKDTYPLLFRCSDGGYVHIVLGVPGGPAKLFKAIGIDTSGIDTEARGTPLPKGDPKQFFGDVDLMQEHIGRMTTECVIAAVRGAGVPIERTLAPGECWSDEQVVFNGIVVTVDEGHRCIGSPIKVDFQPGASTVATAGSTEKPLDGVNIVDFGMYVAGPMASTWLGDLGANIIKVEPFSGDPNRSIFRSFASVNRGKKSLLLDMKSPDGADIVRQLCRRADIVTSNFRPGVTTRLGLSPDALRRLNAGIITLETNGYGSAGPNTLRPAFDPVMQALAGLEVRAGGEGNPPIWSRTVMVDYAAGFIGAVALLLALYHRRRTGYTADATVALLDASIFLLSELISVSDGTFAGCEVLNSSQTGFKATECLYQAKDGWLAIAARGTQAIKAMTFALGLPVAPDELSDHALHSAMKSSIENKSTEEVIRLLRDTKAWVEPCPPDAGVRLLNDPIMHRLGLLRSSDHPEFGRIVCVGTSFQLEQAKLGGDNIVPAPGQNCQQILQGLGLRKDQVDRLRDANIAG